MHLLVKRLVCADELKNDESFDVEAYITDMIFREAAIRRLTVTGMPWVNWRRISEDEAWATDDPESAGDWNVQVSLQIAEHGE